MFLRIPVHRGLCVPTLLFHHGRHASSASSAWLFPRSRAVTPGGDVLGPTCFRRVIVAQHVAAENTSLHAWEPSDKVRPPPLHTSTHPHLHLIAFFIPCTTLPSSRNVPTSTVNEDVKASGAQIHKRARQRFCK